jgi:hypothetical protein
VGGKENAYTVDGGDSDVSIVAETDTEGADEEEDRSRRDASPSLLNADEDEWYEADTYV